MVFLPEEQELELQVEGRAMMNESDDEQGAGNKAWPLRQRAPVLVAALAAVLAVTALAFAFGSTGMQAVGPEPATIEAINVLAPCKAAMAGITPVINDAISNLESTYTDVISVKRAGPQIKLVCTAKTSLIFDVQEIQGLNSGVASASCNQASLNTLKREVSAAAAANIEFAEPLVFTMQLKGKASVCRAPKSYKQKITVTIIGLRVSTDASVALKQGRKTTLTAASISDFDVNWSSESRFQCKGSSCGGASSWVENAIRTKLTNSLTDVIESSVNSQLAQKMPMTVAA